MEATKNYIVIDAEGHCGDTFTVWGVYDPAAKAWGAAKRSRSLQAIDTKGGGRAIGGKVTRKGLDPLISSGLWARI